MKRLVLIAVVVLVLVLVFTPPAIGRFGQDNVEKQLTYISASNPAVTVVTESRETGWFSGESRHRVILTDARALEALEGLLGFADQPALVVKTRMDNGPIAFGSLGRDGGSLAPALSRGISTFALDLGNGHSFELPGRVLSSVGFDGSTRAQLIVEPGSLALPDGAGELAWEGADIESAIAVGASTVSADGVIKAFSIVSPQGGLSVAAIALEGTQRQTAYSGIWVGDLSYSTESIDIAGGPGGSLSIKGLKLSGQSDIEGEAISGSATLSIAAINGPQFRDVAVDLEVKAGSLDAAALEKLGRIMRELQAADDPEVRRRESMPEILANAQRLASGGASLRIERLRVALPQGTLSGLLDLRFDKFDPPPAFSPAELLRSLHGEALLEIPVPLVNQATAGQTGNPVLGMALAYLEKDGDLYRLKASYDNALLSINGLPLPVPMIQ